MKIRSVSDKYMDEYNRQVYYYSQQVREYKETLNGPDKLEQKALVLLNKLPAFHQTGASVSTVRIKESFTRCNARRVTRARVLHIHQGPTSQTV